MSLGKILAITAVVLLSFIGFLAFFKEPKEDPKKDVVKGEKVHSPLQASSLQVHKKPSGTTLEPIEISLEPAIRVAKPEPAVMVPENEIKKPEPQQVEVNAKPLKVDLPRIELPEADRISELFSTTGKKLPFIETVIYKSRVAWQKGRPAWLSDYASYYGTSRHFIARSLNGTPDYFKQEIAEGNKFNAFKENYPLEFQLVVDATRCKMWLYAISGEAREKTLIKTYPVSLGRPDSTRESGILTPLGKYKLGSRIAIYKPKVMGHYKGEKTEMIQVFGTRWIPFESEVGETTMPAKGFGLHGVPWVKGKNGELAEDASSLGKFESDGCVRMATSDMEEVYAIVITKPAYIELVKDFSQSELIAK